MGRDERCSERCVLTRFLMFLSFCEFDKDGISGLEEEAVAWDVDG